MTGSRSSASAASVAWVCSSPRSSIPRPSRSRGAEKADFAEQLGAEHYIDSTSSNAGEALTDLGGADEVIATVTDADAMSAVIPGKARFRVVLTNE